ncbi:MAG TPA: cytochrome c family protein [Caulobacteraceae bacterium]|nr:cytochrome c family protein [Caulobacteraceae bacterium]
MSGFDLNKYVGAALGTALLISVLAIVVPLFFEQTPPAHPGYAIAVAPDLLGGAPAAPEPPPDWGTVLPKADVAAGQAKTAICQSCHDFDPAGTNKIGPGLYGVVGRQPGTHPGFDYSPAMKAFGQKVKVWDYQHIYDFIKGPQDYIPGTKMTFIGMKDSQDRINVIAYLHTLGSTLPIPPPNPKAAAKPAAAGKPSAGAAAAAGAPTAAASQTGTPGATASHAGGEPPH